MVGGKKFTFSAEFSGHDILVEINNGVDSSIAKGLNNFYF